MKDPWYQPRLATFIAAIAMIAGLVAINARERDKGVYRVYLDEAEKLCIAYRAKARGWPQVYAVNYVLDEELTTLQGYPKRKFIDDEYNSAPLWINAGFAFGAFVLTIVVVEMSARMIAMIPQRPKEEPRRRRMRTEMRPVTSRQAVREPDPTALPAGRPITARQAAKEAAAAAAAAPISAPLPAGRPITARQAILDPSKGGRPVSIKQKPKPVEPVPVQSQPRPLSAAATKRQADLRKRLVKR